MKKLLSVFFALLLTSFTGAVYANGEIPDSHSHFICGETDCTEDHGETVNWQAWSGDISVGTADNTGETAIYLYLEKDVTITSTLNIRNVTLYLCLNGNTLTIDNAGNPAVSVGANQKFVLCDCKKTGKITGAKGSAAHNTEKFGAVNCLPGSHFVMYGGSISDNTVGNANGGGVFVKGGTFAMYGGSVNNNKAPNGSGGAISVENGTIDLYGGEMNGNSAINGGAIHMKGNTKGTIRNIKAAHNTAADKGGAVFTETSGKIEFHDIELSNNQAGRGGGIYLQGAADGIYTNIYNVSIHDNTATSNGGGVFLDGSRKNNLSFIIYNSKICDNNAENNGGGIFATESAMLNLYGGTISGNICANSGGGIRVAASTYFIVAEHQNPVYQNPVYIRGNKAKYGGGISTGADMFNLVGKCVIEENTATIQGGGVYINRGYQFLLMKQTTVTKNTAPQGGGIYLGKGDTGRDLEILGGTTVIGNTSSEGGSANNLYLANGRMFQFRKGMNGNEKIGVSVPGTPTHDEPINIEWVYDDAWHAPAGDYSNLIIPDNDNYKVVYKNNKHWLIPKLSLVLTVEKISVSGLERAATLYVASYDGDKLLSIRTMPLDGIEDTSVAVSEIGLNMEGATKITAFLWDSAMHPLCGSAAAEVTEK